MNSESLVNSIFAQNAESAAEAFSGALAAKIADALEVKKVEIASNFISAPIEAEMEPVEAASFEDASLESSEASVEVPTEAAVEE